MAAALAEFVSKKLISLASDQASLLWGLKSEISKVSNIVSSIQAVLLDAEEQSGKSHQVQLWLRGLEDVLYEAEDLLDDFSTEVLRRKQMDGNSVVNEVCLFFSPDNQIAYGLKIANQIKAVRSKLEEIDRNRNQFNFQMRPVEPVADNKEWRQTHSSVPDVVVGREGDKQIIIDMLLSSSYEEKIAVVPIVGIGGLGKTALAQLVYNDDKIKSHFDSRCWVCVSETFEPKVLVKNILESITKKKVEDLALNTLKDLLHEQIKNKRLMLVLDDVWNEDRENWASFMNIFASGATKGSRIVVTTRLPIVAGMAATATIVPHELQGLSAHDSWSLFEKMAFKGGVAPDPRYVEIGKEVLRKCCGVPLAIRTMGGLLFFKDTVTEWERIADKQLLNLDLGGQESEILERTLKLSYDNLPSNLKRCFAYCSLFPKDHRIDVKMLVQLWMAQGYIVKSSQSSELTDIGIQYFKNLLWRSFFQEVKNDRWGNITSCKMHDLVHDLALKVAGEETVCLNASNLSDSLLNINLERIRHLSIDFEERLDHKVCQLPSLLVKATRLRTFLIINVANHRMINWDLLGVKLRGRCDKIFPNMTRLRVLGLRYANIEMVSSIIHVLKHLRYLDLSGNEMKILPNKITRLINLQVLNLIFCENLRLLPADLGKLSNLAYLVLDFCQRLTCIPAGIGNLSFLRELSEFVVTEASAATADGSSQAAGLGELKSLNNLSGRLCIRGLERVTDKSEAEAANLKEKSQLRCLVLQWSDDHNMRCDPDHERSVLEALQPHPNLKKIQLENYGGTSIPTSCCWFSSLRNLVRMELYGCRKLRSLPSLDPLVSLEELWLWGLESLEYVQCLETSSSSSNNDFQSLPSLVSLDISDCRNLIGWSPTSVQDSPLLPGVSRLTISNCPQMVSVPRFRVNFEKVVLRDMCNELLSVFAASLISPPTHPRFDTLSLWCVKDLPQGLMTHLTSLKRLYIYCCDDLTTISPSILRHLPSLQELHIYCCPVLELENYDYDDGGDDDENNNTLCVLPSLHLLHFNNVPKLFTLPKWLQHSSNLRQLEIWKCKNLKCLPSWLTKLTALESLDVKKCDLLAGRCRSNTADDWSNISRIPNITIDHIDVQKDGCYLGMNQQQQQLQQQQQEGDEDDDDELLRLLQRLKQQQQQEEEEGEEEDELLRLLQRQQQQQQQEEEEKQLQRREQQRQQEESAHRITCNLFQRCFLP